MAPDGLPGGAATAAPRCDAEQLLEVVGRLNALGDAQVLVDRLAEAVSSIAGYRAAVISMTLPEGSLVGTHGLPAEAAGTFRADIAATPMERRVAKRTRIRGMVYPGTSVAYVPAGSGPPVGRAFRESPVPAAGTWHPRDRLFILLRGPAGTDIGVASLDEPLDGNAPSADALGALRLAERLLEIGGSLLQTRLLEAQLRDSEERYRRLVDSSPDAIFVHADGRLVFANAAAARLFAGGDAPALVGREALELVHPDFRAVVAERMQGTVRGLRSPLLHLKVLRADGSAADVEGAGIPTTWGGRPAIQVVLRDLGERLKLEDQFRQAQKMEAVGRLAGGVAHEFNNLLTVIDGYGQLARAHCAADAQASAYVDQILAASDRASTLTRELLTFGRRQTMAPVVLDLNSVVRDTQRMFGRLVGPAVEVVTRLDPELGPVRADPRLVGQVLMNLVVNACDAMPRGGTLTIETRNVEVDADFAVRHLRVGPGRYAVLSVTDTGEGMDDATKARIFEPFFTTKAEGKGTGLGLATVFGIVTQCGGDVACRSALGQGSTFRVFLPRVEPAPPAAASPGPRPGAAADARTVLLVEDEPAIRSLAETVLARDGHRVLAAGTPEEAIATCASHAGPIDVLLTDVGLPRMDGRELARRLAGTRPGMRVLFMSGYLGGPSGGSLDLPPGADYLPKPFGPADLRAKLLEVLAPGRAPAAAPRPPA